MIIEKPGNEIPDHVISNPDNNGDQPLPPEEENLNPRMENRGSGASFAPNPRAQVEYVDMAFEGREPEGRSYPGSGISSKLADLFIRHSWMVLKLPFSWILVPTLVSSLIDLLNNPGSNQTENPEPFPSSPFCW